MRRADAEGPFGAPGWCLHPAGLSAEGEPTAEGGIPAKPPIANQREATWRRPRSVLSAITLIVAISTLFGGLAAWPRRPVNVYDEKNGCYYRPPERPLAHGPDPDGEMCRRSALLCPAGECVLMHYHPGTLSPIRDPACALRPGEYAQLVHDANSPWFFGAQHGVCLDTFNCCTFAVGDYIGLTVDDWVGVWATGKHANPMQVILDSYFECLWSAPAAEALARFESDATLREGDVVCIFDSSSGQVTHAGRVDQRDGKNRLLSKFGTGPILNTDLRFPRRFFSGDLVKVFRLQRGTTSKR